MSTEGISNMDKTCDILERYGEFLEKMLAERKLSKVIKAITK
jgi:hypothetical protein